jgi:hypothetical protein
MANDSYLRLVPAAVADAILATPSAARRSFAVACAQVAVEHCARAALGRDDGLAPTLAQLRDRVLGARDARERNEIDQLLGVREDHLYGAACALRADDHEAPYSEFMRLSVQRHAIRALRAALVPDGLSAAARAAFEAISATRDEQRVEELAREMLRAA